MEPITSTTELAAACERLARHPFVTIDTEFLRETTYYPLLCVAQLASSDEAVVVDALAPGIDLDPFFDLMGNERVLKVFHAARQDIEIVWHRAKTIPQPLFDTQVAARFLGLPDQAGYGAVVQSLLGVTLDKSHARTDWARRPLDARQIDYAIGDVTHLARLFPKMVEKLRKTGRGAWLDEEMERISDPATHANDPATAWT